MAAEGAQAQAALAAQAAEAGPWGSGPLASVLPGALAQESSYRCRYDRSFRVLYRNIEQMSILQWSSALLLCSATLYALLCYSAALYALLCYSICSALLLYMLCSALLLYMLCSANLYALIYALLCYTLGSATMYALLYAMPSVCPSVCESIPK